MFITINYIDELMGGTKPKRISIFSIISIAATKSGGCKLFIVGEPFPFRLKESQSEIEQLCTQALQEIMPAAAPPPPPIEPPSPEPPEPKEKPILFELEETEIETQIPGGI